MLSSRKPRVTWPVLSSLILCLQLVGCTTTQQNTPEPENYVSRQEVVVEQSGPGFHIPAPLAALPLEDGPDVISSGAPTVWDVYRKNTILDLTQDNPRIKVQRDWYARHQAYIDRVTERGEPYLYYILSQSIERGIPSELLLLPIVESAFDPFAYSHGQASGIWQFIPSTGKAYGLDQTWWYEGRRDIVAATDGALDFLEDLNRQFDGDWMLALAAYNSGPGTVRREMRKNAAQGKSTDFWALDLPKETRDYVPKLIAIAQIFYNPTKYGIELVDYAYTPYFEPINIGAQLDLAKAAEMSGLSMRELYNLNPAFNRWATDPNGPHRLLVPIDKAEQMRAAIADLPPEKRVEWQRYTIKSGDSILSIAKANQITPALLKQVNNLSSSTIVAGKPLLIPQSSEPLTHYTLTAEQRLGQKLNRTFTGKQKIVYKVGSGDSFWTIARQHGVSTRNLAGWNGMAPNDTLVAGRKLVIWKEHTYKADKMTEQRMRKVFYKARSGDSYARIANRFNISLGELKKWNRVDLKKYLQPGDMLTLYVDVANAP